MSENKVIRLIEGMKRDEVSFPDELYLLDEDLSFNNASVFKYGELTLVGKCILQNGTVVFCFPKYYSYSEIENGEKDRELDSIVKVLIKLRQEKKLLDDVGAEYSDNDRNQKKKRIDPLKLAQRLIVDYMENGVYYEDIDEKRTWGNGKTLWGETVSKKQPIILENGDAIYLKKITRRRTQDYNGIFTKLHAKVLKQCLELLQTAGISKRMHISGSDLAMALKDDDLTGFTGMLRAKLATVFSDRSVSLFKMMMAWCEQYSRFYKSLSCTTSFHDVWEWVNLAVFGNIGEKEGLHSNPPVYCIGGNPYQFASRFGASKAKPDTIYLDIERRKLAVFDSKYYVPSFERGENKGQVYGYPGNSDIAKQVAYLKQIKATIGRDSGFSFSNAFLFPYGREAYDRVLKSVSIKDKLYIRIGYAEGSVFGKLKSTIEKEDETDSEKMTEQFRTEDNIHLESEDRVDLYIVNPEILFIKYLNRYVVSEDEIDLFIELHGMDA